MQSSAATRILFFIYAHSLSSGLFSALSFFRLSGHILSLSFRKLNSIEKAFPV